jgi:hypothetical protein
MVETSVVLFPDSNFFFECREPAECPWAEITSANEIILALCRTVRSEIDKHKVGRDRVTDRARKWTSRIRGARQTNDRLTLREANPKVVLWVLPPVKALASLPDPLDPNRADDRIIAEILAHAAADAGLSNAIFFTDDGGAADTARHVGINAVDIPLDDQGRNSWRLPREADGTEKRIRELEKQVRALEKQYPAISIRVSDQLGNHIEALPIEVVRFPPLSDVDVEQFASQLEAKHPKATSFGKEPPSNVAAQHQFLGSFVNMMQTWEAPSDREISRYLDRDYPAWQEAIRSFYKNLHENLEATTKTVKFSVSISNHGSVPAENALITFEALGGFLFAEIPAKDDEEALINLTLPSAPRAPRGKYVQITGLAFSTRGLTIGEPLSLAPFDIRHPPPRERTKFYWCDRDSADRWQAECEELRHQIEPATFELMIHLRPDIEPKTAVVRCTVSASNLPAPVASVLRIPLNFSEGDTDSYATTILDLGREWKIVIGEERLPSRCELQKRPQ